MCYTLSITGGKMNYCNKSHAGLVFDGEHCPGCMLVVTADALMKRTSEVEDLQDTQEIMVEKLKGLNSEVTHLREALGASA